MVFPSKLVEEAVLAFSKLPGIGKKTALRLVMQLLKDDEEQVIGLANAITRVRLDTKFCTICNNISDDEICTICADKSRQKNIICVVENMRDVLSIENTQQYFGQYHVLGGLLSPLDGIGPDQLYIESLENRLKAGGVEEIIMALNPTIEGDTTIFYLNKVLQPYQVKISSIARGIAFGSDLEYTDEVTLARSIMKRLPIETYIK